MPSGHHGLDAVESSLKRAAAALKDADVPFLLGGSLACWIRGGPQPRKDVDLIVKPADARRAVDALVEAGMRAEQPPEDWLLKAWDGDLLVDVIFHPLGMEIDDELISAAELMNVFSIDMHVMALEDVFTTKLLALGEHDLDYAQLLLMARAVREQVGWQGVRARTASSPYARAFFTLLAELDVLPQPESAAPKSQIRVVPG